MGNSLLLLSYEVGEEYYEWDEEDSEANRKVMHDDASRYCVAGSSRRFSSAAAAAAAVIDQIK